MQEIKSAKNWSWQLGSLYFTLKPELEGEVTEMLCYMKLLRNV